MQRPSSKAAFPFSLGDLELLVEANEEFVQQWSEKAWLHVSFRFFNGLHGIRAIPKGGWKKAQKLAVVSVHATRALAGHREDVLRRADAVEKELSSRFLGCTGEEVAKMEVPSQDPALPPSSHGEPI